jgi:hypothetical protein
MPPVPETFSTTTVWCRLLPMPSATIRPIASLEPPAENGTTRLIGRVGQSVSWACAG